jgi:uncharacterized protein
MPGQDVASIISLLGLEPLEGEGGMFRRVWSTRAGSAIYYLLAEGDVSALHRLTGDELWHHYAGDPVRMVLLGPGHAVSRPILGPDLAGGARPLVVVEAGTWMGASSLGSWSLLGTTMAPPYDPSGFELGRRQDLVEAFPHAEEDIVALTGPAG